MLISYIIPVYNLENFIVQTIESLLANNNPDAEFIFIDDGSTDRSGNIIEQNISLFDHAVLAKKKNGGVSSARNLGIKLASGKFLCFIDGDDLLSPHHFLEMKKVINENKGIRMFIYDFAILYNNKVIPPRQSVSGTYSRPFQLFHALLESRTSFSVFSYIVEKDVVISNNLGFVEDMSYYEDTKFNYEVAFHIKNVKRINTVLYTYIIRSGSATNKILDLRYFTCCTRFIETINNLVSSDSAIPFSSVIDRESRALFFCLNYYLIKGCTPGCKRLFFDKKMKKPLLYYPRTLVGKILFVVPMRMLYYFPSLYILIFKFVKKIMKFQ